MATVSLVFGRSKVNVSTAFHRALIEWGGATPGEFRVPASEAAVSELAQQLQPYLAQVAEVSGRLLVLIYCFGLSPAAACEFVKVAADDGAAHLAAAINAMGDDPARSLAIVEHLQEGEACPE